MSPLGSKGKRPGLTMRKMETSHLRGSAKYTPRNSLKSLDWLLSKLKIPVMELESYSSLSTPQPSTENTFNLSINSTT